MSGRAPATVLAVTSVWRVPADVVLRAPYTVALVQPGDGPELVAVADVDESFEVGDTVELHDDTVTQDGETVQVWRIRRGPPGVLPTPTVGVAGQAPRP